MPRSAKFKKGVRPASARRGCLPEALGTVRRRSLSLPDLALDLGGKGRTQLGDRAFLLTCLRVDFGQVLELGEYISLAGMRPSSTEPAM